MLRMNTKYEHILNEKKTNIQRLFTCLVSFVNVFCNDFLSFQISYYNFMVLISKFSYNK